jgi:hypothetical protein
MTPEKLAKVRLHLAAGLNVREAAARVKVGKTALYQALKRSRRAPRNSLSTTIDGSVFNETYRLRIAATYAMAKIPPACFGEVFPLQRQHSFPCPIFLDGHAV